MKKNNLIVVAMFLIPAVAGAEIYKYTDENGVTRYSDQPPVNKSAKALDIRQPKPEVKTPEQIEHERQAKALAKERAELKERSNKAISEQEERDRQARIRAHEEDNRKFNGCDLAEALKTVSEGKALTQKLIDSATSKNFSSWRQPGGWVGTRILSYEPVCGNQTRYTITINDANYVWELKRDIAR